MKSLTVMCAAALASLALASDPSIAADVTWELPATALSAAGQDANGASIATSASGNRLTAVWRRGDGSHYVVQTRSSTDGGATWSPVSDLSAAGQNADAPEIVASANGQRLTAVWFRNDGTNWVLQARSSTDGAKTWGATTDLSAAGSASRAPKIAASADGRSLTVVWLQNDGSHMIVQTRSSSDGGTTWGATADLSAAGSDAYAPDVAISANGAEVSAVWSAGIGNLFKAQVRTSTDRGATWGTTKDLSPAGEAFNPLIAVSAKGTRLTALWEDTVGSMNGIKARSSTDGGATWGSTTVVSDASQNALNSVLAASADGARLSAIWEGFDGSHYIAQTASSTNGGTTWSPVTNLSDTRHNASDMHLAASAKGTAITAVWALNDGSHVVVQSRASTDSGATWGTTNALSSTVRDGNSPRVAVSASGQRATALWRASDGSHQIVETVSGLIPVPERKLQRPISSAGRPPASIKVSGVTLITGRNARTNAGRLLRTKVFGAPLQASASGDTRYFKVIRGPQGKVSVRTYGRPLKLTVVQAARPTVAYKAYAKRTVYLNGVKQ